MFTKISVLSLFVFCLFSLGQAAPILDDSDISSLSARESDTSLITRGFFHNLFHPVDAVTQKKIDAVSVAAECKLYGIHSQAQQAYITAMHTLTQEKDKLVVKGSKSKDPVVKEYQKRIKDLENLGKTAGKEVKKNRSVLKKLGVEDSHCKSLPADSTSSS